jgi:hypothetical protein
MRSYFPVSLVFFAVTLAVFVLQAIPVTGIFLMFALAMFWSVFLVNAGMIGIAAEVAFGRVPRGWLLLPLAFYGGYFASAAHDHMVLHSLSAAYDAANARAAIPFDANRQSLVFTNDGDSGGWLTQNYALPMAFSANSNFPEGYLSDRIAEAAVCTKVRETPALRAGFVHAFGFHDGDTVGEQRIENRFCALSMPERPELPQVEVTRREEKVSLSRLPATRVTTTIRMPDGQRFQLLGGVAAPLSWIPLPIIGCGVNFSGARWDCAARFWRQDLTPLVSGNTRYRRDTMVLARALGLKPVTIEERKGGDPAVVLAKMATVEDETLTRQLANIDAMIDNPVAKGLDWQVDAVTTHPGALATRADAIMAGLERAAAFIGKDQYRARESGLILARLLAAMPHERFVGFGPRLLALYSRADDKHWLWEAGALLRRLGDLGTEALPYLVNARALAPSVDQAGIEGLCRVGSAGRSVAEPVLISMWNGSRDGIGWNTRVAMFVAMLRIGISPPLLTQDKPSDLARLQAEWADISPQSPSRVCAIAAERQARREEKAGGQRRANLD